MIGTPPQTATRAPVTTPGTANSGTSKTPNASATTEALDQLKKQLVMKMRAKFGEVALDLKSQEIIGVEVAAFISQANTTEVKEADLNTLEQSIRVKMIGGEPPKTTLTMEKRALQEGDEWAKIFYYNISVGKTYAQAEAEANRQRQSLQRATLRSQQMQIEARKVKEREEAHCYFIEQEAALKAWKEDEERKRQAKAEVVRKIGEERKRQLEEKSSRIKKEKEQTEIEEKERAAKLAYESQQELFKEERDRNEAKTALTTFLLGNEANKAVREQEKVKQGELEAKYAKEWNEILDRQERERTHRLEKAKELSKKHEATAMIRFMADDSVEKKKQEENDRILREREEKRDRAEDEKKRRIKADAIAAAATYAQQAAIKAEERRVEKERDEAINKAIVERAKAEEVREKEKQRRALEARLKLKSEVAQQILDNAARRKIAPMSETEKRINAKLLVEVDAFKKTGTISAAVSPTHRPSPLG